MHVIYKYSYVKKTVELVEKKPILFLHNFCVYILPTWVSYFIKK